MPTPKVTKFSAQEMLGSGNKGLKDRNASHSLVHIEATDSKVGYEVRVWNKVDGTWQKASLKWWGPLEKNGNNFKVKLTCANPNESKPRPKSTEEVLVTISIATDQSPDFNAGTIEEGP